MRRRIVKWKILYVLGIGVAVVALPSVSFAFDTRVIDWATEQLCGHITGSFGALLTTVAVFSAIVSATFGSFRTFFAAIVVGVGAYATPNIMSMYFPASADHCTPPMGGRATGQLIDINWPNDPPLSFDPPTVIVKTTDGNSAREGRAWTDDEGENDATLSWSQLGKN